MTNSVNNDNQNNEGVDTFSASIYKDLSMNNGNSDNRSSMMESTNALRAVIDADYN